MGILFEVLKIVYSHVWPYKFALYNCIFAWSTIQKYTLQWYIHMSNHTSIHFIIVYFHAQPYKYTLHSCIFSCPTVSACPSQFYVVYFHVQPYTYDLFSCTGIFPCTSMLFIWLFSCLTEPSMLFTVVYSHGTLQCESHIKKIQLVLTKIIINMLSFYLY